MRAAAISFALFFLLPATAPAGVDAAARYSAARDERALIIWQGGKILRERYRNGGAAGKPENIYSITKSLSALGAFTAIGKGWIRLDEPASLTLTEWRADPRKRLITIRDLLNQTSGLSTGYEPLYARRLRDKDSAVLKLPAVARPGTVFAYGPSHYEALETLLARKLPKPPLAWLDNTVFRPLGMHPAPGWRTDREGRPYFSAGARFTARDLLSAGQLIRRNGWRWIFPIVLPHLIETARQGSPANSMYGLGFWLNRNASKKNAAERDIEEAICAGLTAESWARSCLSRSAPPDLIALVGSRGQRVYISRSADLVIVRLGQGGGFRDPDFLRAFFRP